MWVFLLIKKMLRGRRFFSPLSLIAISGIAFGMTAALVSLSVMSGFEKAYESAILGFNAHIVLLQNEETASSKELQEILASFEITEEEREYWEEHKWQQRLFGNFDFLADPKMGELEQKGIIAKTPFIFREGLAVLAEGVKGVVLKGIDPKTVREVYPLAYHQVESLEGGTLPSVLVGKGLYELFFPEGGGEGATIKLLLPKGESKNSRLADYVQSFRVVGTFESGLHEFDSQFILTSLSVMRRLFNLGEGFTGIEIRLDDPAKANQMGRLMEDKLPYRFQALSWDELNESLFEAMKMEKSLFVIIMLLILFVASFNVMGSILMIILNRQSDVAILMAMGAPKKWIDRTFSLYGLFLGIVGATSGMMISVLFLFSLKRYQWFLIDPEIYFISTLPVTWPVKIWLLLVLATLAVCYFISKVAAKMVIRTGSLVGTFR